MQYLTIIKWPITEYQQQTLCMKNIAQENKYLFNPEWCLNEQNVTFLWMLTNEQNVNTLGMLTLMYASMIHLE